MFFIIIYTKEVYRFIGDRCDICWFEDRTDSSLGLLRSRRQTAQAAARVSWQILLVGTLPGGTSTCTYCV